MDTRGVQSVTHAATEAPEPPLRWAVVAPRSNREQLLKGAMDCLKTKGYARTRARDIAAASGANLASIGYHYGSKEALLDEAVVRICEEWTERMRAAAFSREGATPLERMANSWIAMLNAFEKNRPLLVAFFGAAGQVGFSEDLRQRLAERYRDTRAAVGEMVRASFAEGAEETGADPEVVASYLIAIFDGFALQSLLEPADAPSGEELVGSLGAALTAALQAAQA